MSFDHILPGSPRTVWSAPADSNEVTPYTVDIGIRAVLDSIIVSSGSTGADLTVKINDGSTDYFIAEAYAIAANERELIDCRVALQEGHSIKVTDSVGGELHVGLNLVENN